MARTAALLSLLLCLSTALHGGRAEAEGDLAALPPRSQLVRVREWVENPPAEDFGEAITVLYLAADAGGRSHPFFVRMLPRLRSGDDEEEVALAFVVPPAAEAEGVLDALREAETGAALGRDEPADAAGATEKTLREAGFVGDAVVVFSRSGQPLYASSVTRQNRSAVNSAVRRAVSAERGSMELRVRAVGPDGEPAAGFRVAVAGSDGSTVDDEERVTADDGVLHVPGVGTSPAAVLVFRPGEPLAGVAQAEGEGLVETRVELEEQVPVRGRVTDARGRGLAGARVQMGIRPRFDGSVFRFPVPAGEIRSGEDGRFAATYIPVDVQILFEVSSQDRWTEQLRVWNSPVRAGEALDPFVLLPADQTLDLVLTDMEGEPLPGIVCTLDGRVRIETDDEGRLRLEGAPEKPLPAIVRRGAAVRARTEILPGQKMLAVATREQADAAKKQYGIGEGTPPWLVETWVVGEPLDPAEARALWLLAALVPRSMSPDDRAALLQTMSDWTQEHELRGLRALAVLPAGTPEAEARAAAELAPGVAIAVDAPLRTPGAGDDTAPLQGRTEALWRGWDFRPEPLSFVQEPGGSASPVVMADDMDRTLNLLANRMDQIEENHPLDVKGAVAILREGGLARWIRHDPYDEGAVWAGTETGIVILNPRENLVQRLRGVLGIERLRPLGVAFAPEMVFVGTGEGLVAYQRELQAWNRMVPGGDYDLVDARVERLDQEDDRIEAVLTPRGGRTQTWVYERGRWTRAEGESRPRDPAGRVEGVETVPTGIRRSQGPATP